MARPDDARLAPRQLGHHRRRLTESELVRLRKRVAGFVDRGRRASTVSTRVSAGLFTLLWIVTLIASDSSWVVVTAFWVIVGVGITLWVRRDLRKDLGEQAAFTRRLESAVRRGEADVYDVRATGFVDFEEIEDEGACYAFALADGGVAFVTGQEFYPSAGFPSLDFSLVYVLGEQGQAVDLIIEKRGPRAEPLRSVPACKKAGLSIPESLLVVDGPLDDLEQRLRPRG